MNDTNNRMNEVFIKMMKEKTNEERLKMGCSLFDAARTIVRNSILNKTTFITEINLKIEIFLRFYGLDYNDSDKRKIIKHISTFTTQ